MESNTIDLKITSIFEKHKDVNKKNQVKKNNLYDFHILPNHPSRALFSGPSGSGKTNLLINLLITKHFLFNYYDTIHVFSPSYANDDSFRIFEKLYSKILPNGLVSKKIKTEIKIHPKVEEDIILDVIDSQAKYIEEHDIDKSDKILMIFDDCINEKVMKGKAITSLFFRGRHVNCSIWVTTQSYMKLDRSLRLQLTNVFVFSPSPSEVKRLVDEQRNSSVSASQLESIIVYATKKKNDFLHINKQCEQCDQFRKGLDELVIIEEK